jgi:asparagine synthase (glutamine-hydrolysing)
MCGLVGILGGNENKDLRRLKIAKMMEVLHHRGPDDSGEYFEEGLALSLGHRRLSIIDPERGKQPMVTECGKFIIVFNGAIYNYLELRRDLLKKGHPIRSYSDTEVLVYAYKEWGNECVQRLLGMFAFAIWDKDSRLLFCARDRIGIKPFYYAINEEMLVFGSEIKAILSIGDTKADVGFTGLSDYLTFQFCLGKKTLFKNIYKLEPGHLLKAKLKDGHLELETRQYWDVQYQIDEEHDEKWFVDHLARLIEDSTRIHLRSDVPLGAHLSGGLDSSTVVCLAADMLKGERLSTFTGAFTEGPQFDETEYAKIVAKAVGADYHEQFFSGNEFTDVLPKLIYYMDEPAAGPGAIPQYYVSKLAAQHVKVVLGGQGGDELFIGYARYLVAYLERCLFGAIFETASKSRYAVSLESIVPNLPILQTYVPMMQSLWREGLFDSPDRRYFKLIDRSEGMAALFSGDVMTTRYSPFDTFQAIFNREGLHSLINRVTYFDLKGQLPALLHVEDRTSMAASIESRVPLLDHRIVEFMAKIPPNIKFAGGRMKHIFKEAVKNIVPAQIFQRKDKMGFPVPLTKWLNGVATEFVRETLFSTRARQRGIYNMPAIEKALENEREFGRMVWGLLCLELWHRIFIDGDLKPKV